MRIEQQIIINGLSRQLEHDLGYVLFQFKCNNPEKGIEKARPIVENILSEQGIEKEFELSEDENNIRLEVRNGLKRKANGRSSAVK